jgi:carbonic anhydrase
MQVQGLQAREVASSAYAEPGSAGVAWGYQGEIGPEHWGKLSPAFRLCGEGLEQSPVDITETQPRRLPRLAFQYRSGSVHMVNDGLVIRLLYEPGSYVRVGSHRYELEHVDFHTPGEHTKNGFAPDMEIHLVHRDGAGNYAIVAIPVVAGRRHNSLLSRIWQHLPARPGQEYEDAYIGIKPVFLLPSKKDYYAYQGSLSNPPCSEGVSWFVMRHAIEVPAEYVERFRQVLGQNNRPTQPLNGRPVLSSR